MSQHVEEAEEAVVLTLDSETMILPGKEGLVRIGELADYHVPTVEDVVAVGDEIMVVVIEVDRQGRVTIPPPLRNYAGLDRDIVVAGLGSRVEVWDAATWASYLTDAERNYAEVSGEVAGLG